MKPELVENVRLDRRIVDEVKLEGIELKLKYNVEKPDDIEFVWAACETVISELPDEVGDNDTFGLAVTMSGFGKRVLIVETARMLVETLLIFR